MSDLNSLPCERLFLSLLLTWSDTFLSLQAADVLIDQVFLKAVEYTQDLAFCKNMTVVGRLLSIGAAPEIWYMS